MVTYKKITYDSSKVQVESAIRDGDGKVISTNYALKSEAATDHNHDSVYLKLSGGTMTGNLIRKNSSANAASPPSSGTIFIPIGCTNDTGNRTVGWAEWSINSTHQAMSLGIRPYNGTTAKTLGYMGLKAPVGSTDAVWGYTSYRATPTDANEILTLGNGVIKVKVGSTDYTPSSGIVSLPAYPSAYTSNPAALGTASAGSSTSWARGDHVHAKPSPSDIGAAPTFILETTGSGNAITAISYANNKITATKGTTFPTSDTDTKVTQNLNDTYTTGQPIIYPGASNGVAGPVNYTSKATVVPSTGIISAGGFIGTQLGGTTKTYTTGANTNRLVLARVNNYTGLASCRIKLEVGPDTSSGAKVVYIDAVWAGRGHALTIESVYDWNNAIRYFFCVVPNNTSYYTSNPPEIHIQQNSAVARTIKATIIERSGDVVLMDNLTTTGNTTNRNTRTYDVNNTIGVYDNCGYVQNAGWTSGGWDRLDNDRYLYGEAAVNQSLMAIASDGKLWKISRTDKEFLLPLDMGHSTGTWAVSATWGRVAKVIRGLAYSNFTNTSMQTNAFTVPTLTTSDYGKPIYLVGTLSNGNFVSSRKITLSMETPSSGSLTYIPIGKIDRSDQNISTTAPSAWTLNTYNCNAYTIDSNGKLTHVNGKEVKDTVYSSLAAASGGTAVSLVTTGEKYTWNSKAGTAVVSKTANGLCPQLPNETTTTKFLRQDGSWAVPSYIADTDCKTSSANKASTKLFLIGAETQSSANNVGATTQSNVNCYIGTDNCLYSNGTLVSVNGHTHNYAGSSSAGGAATSAAAVSVTLDTTTKAYVLGTTRTTNGTTTPIFDTGVYLDTISGQLTASKFYGTVVIPTNYNTVSLIPDSTYTDSKSVITLSRSGNGNHRGSMSLQANSSLGGVKIDIESPFSLNNDSTVSVKPNIYFYGVPASGGASDLWAQIGASDGTTQLGTPTGKIWAGHFYKGTTEINPVSFSRSLTSGTKIGTITIDGTSTDIYCNAGTVTSVNNQTGAVSLTLDKVTAKSWSTNEEGRLAVKSGINDNQTTDYIYFTPDVTVNGSTKVITAGGFKGPQIEKPTKTYELQATGYKTILQMKDAATFWTTNSAVSYIQAVVEYSLVAFGSAATLDAKKAVWFINCKYAGNDHSIDIQSIGDSVGTGNGILRYFASFAPKSNSYCPQIAVALDNANTKVYIKVTILSASEGWQCPATIGGDPGTTNYTRAYYEVGRYNYTWSSLKIAANITGGCDGSSASAWDSFRDDRFKTGATITFANGSTTYAIRSAHFSGVGSDGLLYHMDLPDKVFALPYIGGRPSGNFTASNEYGQLWLQQRAIATTELTNTVVMNTGAITAGTTYTGTGTVYAVNWVFRTHTSSTQWSDSTSLTIGKNMYVCGNLDSSGNFKPYYTSATGQSISVPSGQGGFTAATNVTMQKYTFYITQNPTYTANYNTFLFVGRCDRIATNFTWWTLNATAYTYNSSGKLTHIDGRQIYDSGNSGGTVTTTGTITANQIPLFNANSSTVLKQSGVTIATSLTTTSDANVPTSKAVATYVTGLGYTTNTGTVTTTGTMTSGHVVLSNGGTVIKDSGITLTAASTGFTIAGGTTSKTLTVSNTYTLGAACAKAVDTSISISSTSTNLPTTAAVVALLKAMYPVGSVYINASDSTNPGTLLGFGTWTQIGEGNVLLAGTTSGTYKVGTSYGSNTTDKVAAHIHTINGVGNHTHEGLYDSDWQQGRAAGNPDGWYDYTDGSDRRYWTSSSRVMNDNNHRFLRTYWGGEHTHTMESAGDATVSIMQQSIAVYMWKRTA